MKKRLLFLVIGYAALSCENEYDECTHAESIVGFWSRETVYFNGVNSVEYVDFLNNGTNYLELKDDNTFARAYDNGTWQLTGKSLKLDRDETSGLSDWNYAIVEVTKNSLTLEVKLNEGQYCCGFDEFDDSEIIIIKEVYKKAD
jgi:hypothetical protein